MTSDVLKEAIFAALAANGGYVMQGQLCPLVIKGGLQRSDTRIMNAADEMARDGLLVKPLRGVYYLPDAWKNASTHDRSLARFPFGMTDAGRVLYAMWMRGGDKMDAQMTTGEIRRHAIETFGVRTLGGAAFTMLTELGYLNRVVKGTYEFTVKGRDEVLEALTRPDTPAEPAPHLPGEAAASDGSEVSAATA